MVDNSKRLSYGGSFEREDGGSVGGTLAEAITQGVRSVIGQPDHGRFVVIASDYSTGSMGARPGPIVTVEMVDGSVRVTLAPDLVDVIETAVHDARFGR